MTGAGEDTDSGRDLLEVARDYLERSGWDVERHPDEPLLRTVTESRDGTWTSYVRGREREQQLVFYSVHPRSAATARLAEIAEFLHRVNYGTIIGNFELDYGDGEIRFKTSLDVEGEPLSDAQLEKLVTFNVGSMGRHLALIADVIDGILAPLEAMAQVDSF
jgi:hypothetical protein